MQFWQFFPGCGYKSLCTGLGAACPPSVVVCCDRCRTTLDWSCPTSTTWISGCTACTRSRRPTAPVAPAPVQQVRWAARRPPPPPSVVYVQPSSSSEPTEHRYTTTSINSSNSSVSALVYFTDRFCGRVEQSVGRVCVSVCR